MKQSQCFSHSAKSRRVPVRLAVTSTPGAPRSRAVAPADAHLRASLEAGTGSDGLATGRRGPFPLEPRPARKAKRPAASGKPLAADLGCKTGQVRQGLDHSPVKSPVKSGRASLKSPSKSEADLMWPCLPFALARLTPHWAAASRCSGSALGDPVLPDVEPSVPRAICASDLVLGDAATSDGQEVAIIIYGRIRNFILNLDIGVTVHGPLAHIFSKNIAQVVHESLPKELDQGSRR